MSAKTLTVVFTDIQGFTERTSKSSRAQMVKVLEKHEQLLRPIILQHGGRVVKTIGDAFLLTFESPTNAVLCGVRMQACLRAYNTAAAAEDRIDIRVSMNTGEVELIGNDVFGETVNLASRVEGITEAGEVYFTESTYLVMNKAEVPTSEVGNFRFKGIPEQITIYRVVQDEHLELYRKLVQSQTPAEPVEAADEDVPQGAFSTNLLYSKEQQRALEARRRRDPVVGAAVTVLLLAAVVAAYFAFGAYRYRARRSEVTQLLADGNVKEALDRVAGLRQEAPADPQLLALLEQAVRVDVQALSTEQRFEEALRRIEEHRERYPDLPNLDGLHRDTRLTQALTVGRRNAQQGRDLLESLHADYPRDDAITLHLAQHTAVHFDIRRSMFLVKNLVVHSPNVLDEQTWVLDAVLRYVDRVYRDDDTLQVIDRLFYSEVRDHLLAHVGHHTAKQSRRNAYTLLSRHGDLAPLDEFRFFTAELFYRTIIERTFREETFAYFETLLNAGLPTEVQDALPIPLPPPRVLHEGSPDRQRALPIIQALFPQALPE